MLRAGCGVWRCLAGLALVRVARTRGDKTKMLTSENTRALSHRAGLEWERHLARGNIECPATKDEGQQTEGHDGLCGSKRRGREKVGHTVVRDGLQRNSGAAAEE